MTFKLYNAPQSTCSQRVRFVFNAKKLPFDEVKLNLLEGDQLKPDYLKLNPNGVVPTLDHDGAIVIDSTVITEYLDEVRAERQLHARRSGRARPHARAHAFHRRDAGRRRACSDIQSRVPAELPEDEPRRFRRDGGDQATCAANSCSPWGRPVFRRWKWMPRSPVCAAPMSAWMPRSKTAAARGCSASDITLADVAAMPALVRMDDLGMPDWQDLPRVVTWFDNIRAHPAFKPTYYHGSLLSERFPHLRGERTPA